MEKADSDIKSLLKTAETYNQMGLFKESLETYVGILKFIESHERFSENSRLKEGLKKKIETVKEVIAEVEGASDTPEVSQDEQNLISKIFSSSRNKTMAAIEGAVALAQLGQYEKAFAEFDRLVQEGNRATTAAKNKLRCLMTYLSSDTAIYQITSWKARQLFSVVEMEDLSDFLEKELSKKGIQTDLSKRDEFMPDIIQANEKKGNISEITSVQIKLSAGPRRGKSIEFDVSLQRGNLISVIIPNNELVLVEAFKAGTGLTEIQCSTDMGLMQESGVVSGIKVIPSGPRRGDYSVYISLDVA